MGRRPATGELLRDTLDMLVLKTLTRGTMHGYAIAEFIEETTDDVLRVEEGALYPALHRLGLRGLVAAGWGVSENNRRSPVLQADRRRTQATRRGIGSLEPYDGGGRPHHGGLICQIGRASCRERAEISVVAVSLKKKTA